MSEHAGKVVLISGGSRGLGRAIVEDLLGRGVRVATFSRSEPPDRERWESRLLWESVDATDFAAVCRFVGKVAATWGRLDVLINNAAREVDGVLTLTRPDAIRDVIQLNLEATILLARECCKIMLRQPSGGTIINVSSIMAVQGYAGCAAYAATKAGIDGFTRALAREVGKRGIRVNALLPGYMDTHMTRNLSGPQREQVLRRTPLGRLGSEADMLGAVRFLISDDSAFMTGQSLVVDGGVTC